LYEEHIFRRVEKTPHNQVDLQEGLEESTVTDIFRKTHPGFVRILGMDELSVRKVHKNYALILTDLTRRCVLKVFDNRLQETFEGWLAGLSAQAKRAVKAVSMDMWNPYRYAVRGQPPEARIVVDRFHVVKQLNHQLDLLRRKTRRDSKKTNPESDEILKVRRWLSLRNRDSLKPEDEQKLKVILEACPEIKRIFLLKEEFRTICGGIKEKKQAERFPCVWCYQAEATESRYLCRFVRTLLNWREEFLNYFLEGITQGFVEGTNRAVRGIINRAFGFHDFENFRLKILVELGYTMVR
jgi:transposase